MKITAEIEINLPADKVAALYVNAKNMQKWMAGLESYEITSGKAREVGSKALLKMTVLGNKVEMTESILKRNLPKEFVGLYQMNGVDDLAINRFEDLGNYTTRYSTEHEFTFSGYMKIVGNMMQGALTKRTEDYLKAFKSFAEGEGKDV